MSNASHLVHTVPPLINDLVNSSSTRMILAVNNRRRLIYH